MNDKLTISIVAERDINLADSGKEKRVAIEEFSLALQKLSDKYQIGISPMIISAEVSLKRRG